jgi:hypothetical protein
MVSCSSRVANSNSESASSRRGGKPSEQYGDGSAQSVHSRAMLKLPRSNSRSRRVSIPAIRRAFKTWKRWPRSGWNRWRISAHPKCDWPSGAVRAGRRYAQHPRASARLRYLYPPHRTRDVGSLQEFVLENPPVRSKMRLQLHRSHSIDTRRPVVAFDRCQGQPVVLVCHNCFHQALVRRSPSEGSQRSDVTPPQWAGSGCTAWSPSAHRLATVVVAPVIRTAYCAVLQSLL